MNVGVRYRLLVRPGEPAPEWGSARVTAGTPQLRRLSLDWACPGCGGTCAADVEGGSVRFYEVWVRTACGRAVTLSVGDWESFRAVEGCGEVSR